MLPSVARSAMVRCSRPGPKNSTNFPTTPCSRTRSATVSTRSVAVAASSSPPEDPKDSAPRRQRVHALRADAESPDGQADRGHVDHARDAGSGLEQHGSGPEPDLFLGAAVQIPAGHGLDVGGLDQPAILAA